MCKIEQYVLMNHTFYTVGTGNYIRFPLETNIITFVKHWHFDASVLETEGL